MFTASSDEAGSKGNMVTFNYFCLCCLLYTNETDQENVQHFLDYTIYLASKNGVNAIQKQ